MRALGIDDMTVMSFDGHDWVKAEPKKRKQECLVGWLERCELNMKNNETKPRELTGGSLAWDGYILGRRLSEPEEKAYAHARSDEAKLRFRYNVSCNKKGESVE